MKKKTLIDYIEEHREKCKHIWNDQQYLDFVGSIIRMARRNRTWLKIIGVPMEDALDLLTDFDVSLLWPEEE